MRRGVRGQYNRYPRVPGMRIFGILPISAGRQREYRTGIGGVVEHPLWSPFRAVGENEDLAGLLSSIPVFQGLSHGNLKVVERMLHARTYGKGEMIFTEGEPGAGMYIIVSGEVEITRRCNGGELSLAIVKQREFFGELALLDEMARSASARALTPARIYGFTQPSLHDLCVRNPRVGIVIMINLSRIVCKRLVKSNEALQLLQDAAGDSAAAQGNRESAASHG